MNSNQPNPDKDDRQGPLSEEELAIYQWQMWVPGFGQVGQEKLKQASVLISRVGGVGGAVAYQLAAAGIGKLILAHAGNIKPSDLNRQLLMTYPAIGTSRMDSIRDRLLQLNPRLQLVCESQNINEFNAAQLVEQCDVIVDCAPVFPERFALNRQAVAQRKPMIECAMYELETRLTTIVPGVTPCLQCLYPSNPTTWKRQFPVFGAVSGTVGSMAAMEAIKVIAGLGEPLLGRMLIGDLSQMTFRTLKIARREDCEVCSNLV